MLAVVWGIEHFHIYLYGTMFLLLTDHKPLVSILGNPRSLPSARLERLALRIQQYTFEVQHTSGPSNPSDYLSRHPVNSLEEFQCIESVAEEYVNFVVSHSLPHAMTIEEVTRAALKGPQHFKYWKSTTLQPFHHVATELAVSEEGPV
uniref:Poly protein like family protein n=1 Tax=Rhipicephalus appendiculatus TaxID=34631 RepID=A0A131YFM9_RHIAP